MFTTSRAPGGIATEAALTVVVSTPLMLNAVILPTRRRRRLGNGRAPIVRCSRDSADSAAEVDRGIERDFDFAIREGVAGS